MTRYAWCLLLILPGATATADDWPQWQGPDRNAISRERGLLREWPKAGPPLAWYDQTNGEIGDICAWNSPPGQVTGGNGVTVWVQAEWSNAANNCPPPKACDPAANIR